MVTSDGFEHINEGDLIGILRVSNHNNKQTWNVNSCSKSKRE
jgi:hypothetical protein